MSDLIDRLQQLGNRAPRPAPPIEQVRAAAQRRRQGRIVRRIVAGVSITAFVVVGVGALRASNDDQQLRTGPSSAVTARDGDALVTVEPAKKLSEGDVVRVTGRGFPADTQLSMAMCPAGTTVESALSSCDISTVSTAAKTDHDGSFASTFRVRAPSGTIGTSSGCTIGSRCALGVTPSSLREGPLVTVPLTFAKAPRRAAPTPTGPPAVSVLNASVVRDRQRVTIVGSNFEPGSQVAVALCETGTTLESPGACGGLGANDVTVGSDGTFQREATLYRQIFSGTGFVDCGVENSPCSLRVLRVADGTIVEGPVRFDASEPAPPLPQLNIEAAQPAADGVVVTVVGTGFPSNQPVNVAECATDPPGNIDPATCITPTTEAFTSADDQGNFRITAPYRRVYNDNVTPIDCGALAAGCVLAYYPSEGDSIPMASTPLIFTRQN